MASDAAENQLRNALYLLANPTVRDFLLEPDALTDFTILTDSCQRAASFSYKLHRVVWGVPALASQAHSSWLCTPAFSVGSVTVGVVVQRLSLQASPELMAARPSGHAMLRFAIDPNAGVLLTVSAESPAGTFDIQFAAFHSMGARIALNAVVRAAPLRLAIDNNFDSALLRRAMVFSFAHNEKRDCPVCGGTCTCAPSFPAPTHALDFSTFGTCMAGALGNYSGSGEQQLAVHYGVSPLCAKNMFVRLAVRHLDDRVAVNKLWEWAVQSRYANLPVFPARVHMPGATEAPPAQRCIVEELDALRDEEERCNSFSAASAASVGSAEIGVDPILAAGIQYPSISPEDLATASPTKPQSPHLPHPQLPPPLPPQLPLYLQTQLPPQLPPQPPPQLPSQVPSQLPPQLPPEIPPQRSPQLPQQLPPQLPRAQPGFQSPNNTDPGLLVEAVTPPRPQPSVVHRLLQQSTAFQPPTQMYQSPAAKPQVGVSRRVSQSGVDQVHPLSRQVPLPQDLALPQGQPLLQSLPVPQSRSQHLPHRAVEEYSRCAHPEPEKFSAPVHASLSSTSQNSNIPSTAQAFGPVVPSITTVSTRGVQGALLPTEKPLGTGVTQPNPGMTMLRPVVGRLPSGAVSHARSHAGADLSAGGTALPIALQMPTVLPSAEGPMPVRVKAPPVPKPFRQRVAARIEKNPHAPAVLETTYIGERDRKLLDRKERNRKSAARSNLRRKQARLALERNLVEENAKLENLKQRQAELKAENDLLRKSLVGEEMNSLNLCEGAS